MSPYKTMALALLMAAGASHASPLSPPWELAAKAFAVHAEEVEDREAVTRLIESGQLRELLVACHRAEQQAKQAAQAQSAKPDVVANMKSAQQLSLEFLHQSFPGERFKLVRTYQKSGDDPSLWRCKYKGTDVHKRKITVKVNIATGESSDSRKKRSAS